MTVRVEDIAPIFMLVGVLTCYTSWLLHLETNRSERLRDEAVRRGFAYYHPETARFTWREPPQP